MELYELMAHVAAHGPGVPPGSCTSEWAAAKGLPLVCDRCGLPFDRTGGTRHTPAALNAQLVAGGQEPIANTHCVRFLGRDELWTCEGQTKR